MKKIIRFFVATLLFCITTSAYAQEFVVLERNEFNRVSIVPKALEVVEVNNGISLFAMDSTSYDNEGKTLFDFLYEKIYNCEAEYYQDVSVKFKETDPVTGEEITKVMTDKYMYFEFQKLGYDITLEDFNKILKLFTCEYGELLIRDACHSVSDNKVISGGFRYLFDRSEIPTKRAEIDAAANSIISSIDPTLSDIEKVLLVHDNISRNAIYVPINKEIEPIHHSLYAALIKEDGKNKCECVCQGYTLAMCYILNKMDIECVACACDIVNHVWNCVKIDGKWYHLDLTWNETPILDPNNNTIFDAILYDEFMNSSYQQLLSKFTYYYNDMCQFEEENADKITDNLKEYIVTIKQIYSNIQNKLYTEEQTLNILSQVMDFDYISQNLSDELTNNDDFESGYIFNNVNLAKFNCKFNSATEYSELFIPNGFIYTNGKFVHNINPSKRRVIQAGFYFEYDSLSPLDIAVSKPLTTASKNSYLFLIARQNNEVTGLETIGGFMKNTVGNSFAINNYTMNSEFYLAIQTNDGTTEKIYELMNITDTDVLSHINNSDSTQLYFWDENMRPLSGKLTF